MAFFDNGEPEEVLLFTQNLQITLEASIILTDVANIQYLCSLIHGEALRQLYTLSIEMRIITTEHLNLIPFGLGACFFLLMRCKIKSAPRNEEAVRI